MPGTEPGFLQPLPSDVDSRGVVVALDGSIAHTGKAFGLRDFKWETDFVTSSQNDEPQALYQPDGTLCWQAPKSTLWGQWPSSAEDPADPGLAFAGQYRDTESGLCYNRFRYYDPAGGCYVSPDPIGVLGGESNYGYVQNPNELIDPLGLAGCSKYLKGWGRGKAGFENFWNNSTQKQFMKAWSNPKFKENIMDRLRKAGGSKGGGFHEWLPVSQADKFKQMGVSFNDYMKWRTPTGQVKFLDDLGVMGTHTLPHSGGVTTQSSLAHSELIKIAGKATDINSYLNAVRKWSSKRLPFGLFDLPF
ncbi:YD repeat protein [Pectobacterium actinidiae]|nr:YD repeat protein [Pectobacterium actinidiae]